MVKLSKLQQRSCLNLSRVFNKICNRCNEKYQATGSKQIYCNKCSTVNVNCHICNNIFGIKRIKYENIIKENNEHIFLCSRKCSATYASKKNIEYKQIKFCNVCNKETTHFKTGLCCRCHALKNGSNAFSEWSKSEECSKLRIKNVQKYNNSKIGKENSSKIIKNWLKSEEGQKHITKNLKKIHKDMSENKGANSPESRRKSIETRMLKHKLKINNMYKSLDINLKIDNTLIEDINLNTFDSFIDINGVWSVWGKIKESDNYICLDVAETINIGKEMNTFLRKCISKRNNKYEEISKYKFLEFKIVKLNIVDKIEREKIEYNYAVENKSLFWNPAPKQEKYFK